MTDKQEQTQERLESRGATVEEAVSEALLMLGARRDEVEIEVLDEGKAGVLGLFGKRAARVAVTRRPKRTRGRRGGRRRRGRGGKDEPRDARPAARRDDNRPADREPAPRRRREEPRPRRDDGRSAAPDRSGSAPRPGSDDRRPPRERTRPERAGRDRPAPPPREAAPEVVSETASGGDRSPSRERTRRPRRRPETAPATRVEPVAEKAPAASAPPETAPIVRDGETVAAADLVSPLRDRPVAEAAEVQRGLAEELMRRAGFAGRCTVDEGEYNQIKIVADVDSAAVLIGRRGSTIDAVEHLVDRMALQAVGEHVRMNLDINNYRRRRQGVLEENALASVRELRDTGKDVHTPPLVARERRIVHLTIEPLEGVTTYTAGEGPDRHVVVTFAKDGETAEVELDEDNGTEAMEIEETESVRTESATETVIDPEPEDVTDDAPEPDASEEKPDANDAP